MLSERTFLKKSLVFNKALGTNISLCQETFSMKSYFVISEHDWFLKTNAVRKKKTFAIIRDPFPLWDNFKLVLGVVWFINSFNTGIGAQLHFNTFFFCLLLFLHPGAGWRQFSRRSKYSWEFLNFCQRPGWRQGKKKEGSFLKNNTVFFTCVCHCTCHRHSPVIPETAFICCYFTLGLYPRLLLECQVKTLSEWSP